MNTPISSGIVYRADIQKLLGLETVGLLCWLIGYATADADGKWRIRESVKTLAKMVGWSEGKLTSHMKSLAAAGLVEIERGMRFGPSGGSMSNAYRLSFEQLELGDVGKRDVVNRDLPGRHLVAVSGGEMSRTGISNHHVVVEELNNQQQATTEPRFLTDALKAVGWTAPAPRENPDVVAAVANYIAGNGRYTNPPGLLHSLIKTGKLMEFAVKQNLLPSDPRGALGGVDGPSVMPLAQYTALSIANPSWAEAVSVEAQRRASATGVQLGMLLIRAVAQEMQELAAAGVSSQPG